MQVANKNLPIKVTGRHVTVTDPIKEYALKKVEGVHLDYPRIIEAQVILDVQKYRQTAEVILHCCNHITIEASVETDDLYASIDQALDKIAQQMRKYKTKIMRQHRPRRQEVTHIEEQVFSSEGLDVHRGKRARRRPHREIPGEADVRGRGGAATGDVQQAVRRFPERKVRARQRPVSPQRRRLRPHPAGVLLSTTKVAPLTVGEFYTRHSEGLQMKLIGSSAGFDRRIREPTINRPGLALSGFYTYFADKRIQVLGSAERSYLKSLSAREIAERIRVLCGKRVPCLVISRGAKPARELLEEAEKARISVFQTPMITMKFINAATIALETDFAPVCSEYGSMVDILGIGTLIRGSSGIGKSECVLGLIERGHSLVSDDMTRLRAIEGRELDRDGAGPYPFPHGSARARHHQRHGHFRDRDHPD